MPNWDLCTCYSLCLEWFSPSFFSWITVRPWLNMSLSQECIHWLSTRPSPSGMCFLSTMSCNFTWIQSCIFCELHRSRHHVSFYSLLYVYHLAQCLASTRFSINICRVQGIVGASKIDPNNLLLLIFTLMLNLFSLCVGWLLWLSSHE